MRFKKIFIFIITVLFITIDTVSFSANSNDNLKIYSDAVILIDSTTGNILYEKNSEKKMYPASTTKILTSIIAIENSNLSDIATVSKRACKVPSGYTTAYLSKGEKISVEYLLEVFLLHSANEAGNVLAEHVSGSIENFVEKMNQKAKEIGCTNTNFVNTNGIHDNNHYTTAKDLAMITNYCMKNSTFRRIVAMKSCTIPSTNKFGIRKFKNTNGLVNPSSKYYYPYCVGGKTGYTSEAQNCLISACVKDNLKLITVVLKSPHIKSGESTRYLDSVTLFNYGFSNYSFKKIASKNDKIENVDIQGGNPDTKNIDLILSNDLYVLSKNTNFNIDYKIELDNHLKAPIAQNTIVGKITYTVDNNKYSIDLLASHDVIKSDFPLYILILILALILIIITVFIIIRIIIKKNKNKKIENVKKEKNKNVKNEKEKIDNKKNEKKKIEKTDKINKE